LVGTWLSSELPAALSELVASWSVGLIAEALKDLGVQIADLDNADPTAHTFIDLRSTCARRLALEILAAADDADWQTEQDGCPEPAR